MITLAVSSDLVAFFTHQLLTSNQCARGDGGLHILQIRPTVNGLYVVELGLHKFDLIDLLGRESVGC